MAGAAADLLMAKAGELAPVLTAEQGKPLQDATFEIIGVGVENGPWGCLLLAVG
jgi:acyl-CoA reductase-like NAD-dependent aldehyde dehydrogenase